jgi:hypothetical protein
MGRIEDNEKRLDTLNKVVLSLDKHLDDFEDVIHEYYELNEYYGSKEWLQDKEDFENGKIKDVKAGVLSEDAVWDLDERISDLTTRMSGIIELLEKEKDN